MAEALGDTTDDDVRNLVPCGALDANNALAAVDFGRRYKLRAVEACQAVAFFAERSPVIIGLSPQRIEQVHQLFSFFVPIEQPCRYCIGKPLLFNLRQLRPQVGVECAVREQIFGQLREHVRHIGLYRAAEGCRYRGLLVGKVFGHRCLKQPLVFLHRHSFTSQHGCDIHAAGFLAIYRTVRQCRQILLHHGL